MGVNIKLRANYVCNACGKTGSSVHLCEEPDELPGSHQESHWSRIAVWTMNVKQHDIVLCHECACILCDSFIVKGKLKYE